ncbi:MAG: hypothetical protein AVDCRST_MAG95-682 [uncultured Adhaeribacter sp.]|uniref:Histidine kinase/HSP90-like ATPase domain-containing protein n=1 Tax=uncultured Adhaeribacter sp. TaxID=448109 RepID=A0A6J4HJG6_9BACT|nr:MAG: hypothetical protein AVDCRST_MAG95-682 [uncultured Adhaeribacter sp.]
MSNAIQVNCNTCNLQLVRNFVTEFLTPYALPEIVLNQMILAVDEISANLIIHANNNDNTKHFILTILHQSGDFIFEFKHWGIPFDKEIYKAPNLPRHVSGGRKGGLGLSLVNYIMDKVEFYTDKDGVHFCRLYKKVPAVKPATW